MKYVYLITLLSNGGKIAEDMKKLLEVLNDKNVFKEPVEYRIEGCAIFIKTNLKFSQLDETISDLLSYKNVHYYIIEAYLNVHSGYGPSNLWEWMRN